jgi:hypothetical protein
MRLALLLAVAIPAWAATHPGSNDNFPNPERGFFIQTAYNPDRQPQPLDPAILRRARENGMSLLRMSWVPNSVTGRSRPRCSIASAPILPPRAPRE